MRGKNRSSRFLNHIDAVSAVEFSIIFPVLLVVLLSGFQLVVYLNAVRKTELLASSISEMISQAAPPNEQTTTATVNQLDLHFSTDSSIVIFPYLLKDAARQNKPWWQNISINYSSILFTKISDSCGTQADQSKCYRADVVWTSTSITGGNSRPCKPAQLPTASNVPNKNELPAAVFGPGSIVAIDIVYDFTPLFGSNVIGPLRIARSVYVQPRYASLIDYDLSNNDGIAVKCL